MTNTDGTDLNLIDRIDEKTGASVGMWKDVNAAPVEFGALLAQEAAIITDRDIIDQVTAVLATGEAEGIDIQAVADEIHATYGLVDIDTIESATFWDIVAKHDRTNQR
jgi:hypothetical protein